MRGLLVCWCGLYVEGGIISRLSGEARGAVLNSQAFFTRDVDEKQRLQYEAKMRRLLSLDPSNPTAVRQLRDLRQEFSEYGLNATQADAIFNDAIKKTNYVGDRVRFQHGS